MPNLSCAGRSGSSGAESRRRLRGRLAPQGLATLALCTAYGVTGDPTFKGPAQRTLTYLGAARANPPEELRPADKHTLWLMMAAARQGQLAGLSVLNAERRRTATCSATIATAWPGNVSPRNIAASAAPG